MTAPNKEETDAPSMPMLPPVILLLHIIAGITLNWVIPISISHGWGVIGLVLVIGALFLTKDAKKAFESAGTNVAPNLPATTIVTTGPFARTRNPMYLSFMMIYIGLSLLASAPIMLIIGAHLFYHLNSKIIPTEEKYLLDKFGNTYIEYKENVRRWL